MRRLAVLGALGALLLSLLLMQGPAAATEAPEPTPTPTSTASPTESPTPAPQPNDGIREIPTEDEGADVYSVVTILLFFVIAMGIFVFIIRTGMRASSRED